MIREIIILIILIGINAFFAAAEISVVSLREISLEKKASEGDKKAEQLLEIIKEPSKFLSTIQVGVTLASFFTSASAAVGLSKVLEKVIISSNISFFVMFAPTISFVTITILVSFLSLLFGELIPKRLALRKSELIASKSVGVIRIIDIIAKPLVLSLTKATNFFVNLITGTENEHEDQITEEEIRMMINVGEEKGIFRKAETEMINSIFQFDDTTVSDVMTPRPDMVTLNIESSFKETLKVITDEKYSRIPVYEDNIDNIVGILYTKDIIDYMAFNCENDEFNLKNFIKEPYFVTEYMKIDMLLKEMQKRSIHISIVIDEYGTTAGLITIEDMLEEIVGNIYDEYDEMEEEIAVKGEDEFEIDGGINMWELNELLDSNYSENYDTVSGLVLDYFGRFPKKGESIVIENYKFTILEIENKRIKKILVKKQG
ncbi:hemolysin family protein [Clostridium sp. SYSU_GA19001]|uniref:hemolysin family protein n=1 Tax=Clostridium caldaquaticum TaxID=2940653 RepID=UPI0020772992|nr:hemolysin family protein [Clostridium caldaquaticum]MCM8711155.1 hemolysin family protein [Clostridium caldaquaticum]